MDNNHSFTKAYNQLNTQQKLAVDTIDGAVMVMAGPGTGKTQVLATRIAKILQDQDITPQNILALTFTDAAAKNMRERVVSLIGQDGYYVNILTFHSFASEVIREFPEKFSLDFGTQPLSDFERFEVFENIFNNTKLNLLKPINSPFHYLQESMKRISELKRENISPEKFEQIITSEKTAKKVAEDEFWEAQQQLANAGKKAKSKLSTEIIKWQKNIQKQEDLNVVYIHYIQELKKRKRYDFDDMILFVVEAFEAYEDLLLDFQERFQYILVDEYQDTNAAQNKIVSLLGSYWSDDPNIFVVGDPHQSIYRFQGASTENMLQFALQYPHAKIITLKTGYRCFQEVYDAAHELISHNVLDYQSEFIERNNHKSGTKETSSTLLYDDLFNSLQQKLESKKGSNHNITVYEADSESMELLFVAEEIKKLLQTGVLPHSIAVLYHNNAEGIALQEVFDKWEIEYELSIGTNAIDDPLVQQLLKFLQVIRELSLGIEGELLFEVMQYSWVGLNRVSVYKLVRIAGKLQKTVGEVLELEYFQIKENYNLSETEFNLLVSFKLKILQWYQLSKNVLFHEWFSLLISENNSESTQDSDEQKPNGFGFIKFIAGHPVKTDHLLAVNSLFVFIKQSVRNDRNFGLDTFLQRIAIMQEHQIKIPVTELSLKRNKVALSTVHSAKGKEWEYVFVIGCIDKKWGNGTPRELIPLPDSIIATIDLSKKEKNEDDRRLFYVAITRGSKKVYLSLSKTRIDGKDSLRSMFVAELGDQVLTMGDEPIAQLQTKSVNMLEKLLESHGTLESRYSKIEEEFFLELVKDFKLSVTALNNYLKDPQEFFVNSLLHAPRAKTPILSFGTAVHFALEKFYSKLQSNKVPTKEDLLSLFEFALNLESLRQEDAKERLEYGTQVLTFYYNEVLSHVVEKQKSEHLTIAPVSIERFFGGSLNQAILTDGDDKIYLSGRMDRVDILDKIKKTVRVVDYKTGSPKSENVIIGQTSISDYSNRELSLPETIRGRLQRQMVFYKLLAELDKTFGYTVEQVMFDFVEPGGAHKNSHITRSFTVTDTAVEDLKHLITDVMKEIRELRFLVVE